MRNEKVGVIGGGNMGEAIIAGVIEKGIINPEQIFVSDIKEERLNYLREKYRVGVTKNNKEVLSVSTLILLAVKPQDMRKVVLEFKDASWEEKLFVSIAAGLKISFFKNLLGPHLKIVRVMPNLCIKVKKGITAISPSPEVKREEVERVKAIFSSLGRVLEIEEDLMDGITAFSGSGPAYVFYFLEALEESARSLGFPSDVARALSRQLLEGSFELLKEEEDPIKWRLRVTSPGGTTERAISYFEKKNLKKIIIEGIKEAMIRARELSQLLES